MRSKRQGFTIIEMLIVIGIILILFGMLWVGISYVGGTLRADATKSRLQALRAMEAEWLTANYPPSAPPWVTNTCTVTGSTTVTLLSPPGTAAGTWTAGNPNTIKAYTYPPALLGDMARNSPNGDRNTFWSLRTTNFALDPLYGMPNNRTLLQQMPVRRQSLVLEGGGTYVPGDHTGTSANVHRVYRSGAWAQDDDAPVYILLDGWNNPIIWVPPSGLPIYDVNPTNGTVDPTTAAVIKLVKSPDGRGFWASAGPDGLFQGKTTDTSLSAADRQDIILKATYDNIYSFEN